MKTAMQVLQIVFAFLQDKRNAVIQVWMFEQLSYDFLKQQKYLLINR